MPWRLDRRGRPATRDRLQERTLAGSQPDLLPLEPHHLARVRTYLSRDLLYSMSWCPACHPPGVLSMAKAPVKTKPPVVDDGWRIPEPLWVRLSNCCPRGRSTPWAATTPAS